MHERALRFAYMITKEAQKRAKILTFWKRYGLQATEEACGVKERTLYHWQKDLREAGGKLEALNCDSRAPKNKRRRRYDHRIIEKLEMLREKHPNLGEKKLYPLLKEYCDTINLPCPKPSTIGRIMKDKGGMRTVPQKITGTGRVKKINRQKVLRKPKGIKPLRPGHLVALDTIERFIHGVRRYIITCEDIDSRFAFAWCTNSHASKAAEEFFEMWLQIFPHQTTFVLTDNGSEFKKHFSTRLKELQITHYHTYPRTPKMNAHIERFNRTIQEEFVDHHNGLLLDPHRFNEKLMDWLVFYNTRRVHCAFNNKLSPVQYLALREEGNQLTADCKSGWGYTNSCIFRVFLIA
jgi:transposase InsO family protein